MRSYIRIDKPPLGFFGRYRMMYNGTPYGESLRLESAVMMAVNHMGRHAGDYVILAVDKISREEYELVRWSTKQPWMSDDQIEAWLNRQEYTPKHDWKKALFHIDDGPKFTGLHRGDKWNGWAKPVFDLKVVNALEVYYNQPDSDVRMEWRGNCLVISDDSGEEPCVFEPVAVTVDHCTKLYWPVGDGWCWDVVEIT